VLHTLKIRKAGAELYTHFVQFLMFIFFHGEPLLFGLLFETLQGFFDISSKTASDFHFFLDKTINGSYIQRRGVAGERI